MLPCLSGPLMFPITTSINVKLRHVALDCWLGLVKTLACMETTIN